MKHLYYLMECFFLFYNLFYNYLYITLSDTLLHKTCYKIMTRIILFKQQSIINVFYILKFTLQSEKESNISSSEIVQLFSFK